MSIIEKYIPYIGMIVQMILGILIMWSCASFLLFPTNHLGYIGIFVAMFSPLWLIWND